ncbi:hypothetical protein BJ085DRAFT_39889 [Dimargaris cristalligena]|uniref:Uncharacterized protein n=1 Tax=Dimargaris cristalligena TaxID=215637 RepID=A0A4P9ZYE2_9FUNG|nr:hypothetical protein BJ085DRAFT_39889 [Dimargaris cristalligena]|eukprot:RKP38775.1 hypothetical protein BJ085DRAFT_39889 [Dimargaris cristalligena]
MSASQSAHLQKRTAPSRSHIEEAGLPATSTSAGVEPEHPTYPQGRLPPIADSGRAPGALLFTTLLLLLGYTYVQWLDLVNVWRYDDRVTHTILQLSALAFLPFAVTMFYFRIYVQGIRGIRVNWNQGETLYPTAIRVASFSLVLGYLLIIIAFWPVWGFLTVGHVCILSLGLIGVVRLF